MVNAAFRLLLEAQHGLAVLAAEGRRAHPAQPEAANARKAQVSLRLEGDDHVPALDAGLIFHRPGPLEHEAREAGVVPPAQVDGLRRRGGQHPEGGEHAQGGDAAVEARGAAAHGSSLPISTARRGPASLLASLLMPLTARLTAMRGASLKPASISRSARVCACLPASAQPDAASASAPARMVMATPPLFSRAARAETSASANVAAPSGNARLAVAPCTTTGWPASAGIRSARVFSQVAQ